MRFQEKTVYGQRKKTLSKKAVGLHETSEDRKKGKFENILLLIFTTVYKQNTKEKWSKGCIHLFPQKKQNRNHIELQRHN